MGKQTWKAGNMLYPLPAVMVSVRGKNGEDNIITVAWAGTVCTNPPMVSISVRPERYSYQMKFWKDQDEYEEEEFETKILDFEEEKRKRRIS